MEFLFLGKQDWEKIPPISFDYAILEKKFKKMVIPLDIFWSDLGTYESLYSIKESVGNVEKIKSENCFTFSDDKLLVTNNVKNLNIINTKDFTLVAKKGDSKEIREIVSKLKKKRKKELLYESESNRPWGSFTNLG